MRYLDEQVALITAGGGAIGRACAELFADEGARIAVADINVEAAEATTAKVRVAGGEAFAIAADALIATDCARVVSATVERYGKLTILVNLVGLFGRMGGGGVDTVRLDEWDAMMDINLKSVFLMSKHAIPEMLRAGGGAIVNTGTLAAVIGRGGSPCYGAAKSGVLSLTRAMAADYFHEHIRVNCVCPSGTDTPMYAGAMSRRVQAGGLTIEQVLDEARRSDQGLATPEEIAASFLFLASDRLSSRVTGHILMADNGFSILRL